MVEALQVAIGVGQAVAAAAVYSLLFYAKRLQQNPDEKFEPKKAGATVVVGVGVGIAFVYAGAAPTQATVAEALVLLSTQFGAIAAVETLIKLAVRKYQG